MAIDRNLRAFMAVAQSGNLTRAADGLGLTQPSVTKRIANLEAEIGSPLFERHRRGMHLTAAGRLLHERTGRIEADYESVREEIAAMGTAGMEVLRVGAGPLFHLRYIAPAFNSLKAQYPALTLELLADANVRTIPMLLDHRLDVVMGMIFPDQLDDSIHVHPITHVEHGIVLSPDDPLAAEASIDSATLRQREWVLYTTDPETEERISTAYLPEDAVQPRIGVRTSSFTTGLQLVMMGNFIMSAPLQLAPVIENHGLVIRPAAGGMSKREAGIHVRKSALGFPAINALLAFFDG